MRKVELWSDITGTVAGQARSTAVSQHETTDSVPLSMLMGAAVEGDDVGGRGEGSWPCSRGRGDGQGRHSWWSPGQALELCARYRQRA